MMTTLASIARSKPNCGWNFFLVGIAWYFCSQAPLDFTRHHQRAPSAPIQIKSQPRPMTENTHACIDNLTHNLRRVRCHDTAHLPVLLSEVRLRTELGEFTFGLIVRLRSTSGRGRSSPGIAASTSRLSGLGRSRR